MVEYLERARQTEPFDPNDYDEDTDPEDIETMTSTRKLAILIFPDVEILDFCGPYEVFSVANRFVEPAAFNVFTVAEKPGPVVTHNSLSVNPNFGLADCPRPDLLLVPRGRGTRAEMNNMALIDWIKNAAADAELVLSVCTGSLLLAKAGLLDGLEATTHHGAMDLLREAAPAAAIRTDRRFVDNGRVICSAGIAAGIDMSLHVVARLHGDDVAAQTAKQMEYPWLNQICGAFPALNGLRPETMDLDGISHE